MLITIEILRTNGDHETVELNRVGIMREIAARIGAEALSTVNLRDGRVMLIDDDGYVVHDQVVENPNGTISVKRVPMAAKKPTNPDATQLYWNVCRPGTTHQIVGDAAIVVDEDLA